MFHPFRDAPPPPPSVPTKELEASLRQRRQRFAILAAALIAGPFAVFPLWGFATVEWERWQSRSTRLTPEQGATLRASLDRATTALAAHEQAFREFWPKMVDGSVGPAPAQGACPLNLTAPAVRTTTSPEDGKTQATLLAPEEVHAPAHFMLIDHTQSVRTAGIATEIPVALREASDVVANADSPVPSALLAKARARVVELGARVEQPFPIPEHPVVLAEAEGLATGDGYGEELVIVVDAWIAAAPTERNRFVPGVVRARGFVWVPGRERALCAADLRTRSSAALVYQDNPRALEADLMLHFYRGMAEDFVGIKESRPELLDLTELEQAPR